MSYSASRSLRILLPSTILILSAAIGCGGGSKRLASIALDSGVDKKVSSQGYAAGEAASPIPPSAPGYEAGRAKADEAPGSPATPGSISADSRILANMPNIDAWFAPKAYAADNQVSEKFLIRTGTLSLKLDNMDDATRQASLIAGKYSGTITDSNITKDSAGYRSGYVTLRVPAERFFQAWNELRAIGEVTSEQMQAQDVSGDYVSSVSHLKALVAEQATLQKMFDEALAVQRSRGLGEAYKVLLDTEERLKAVSEEMQGTSDHVKQLADQITRSTITVNLTENPKLPGAAPPDKFSWGLGATFNSAVRDLLESARGFTQGVIYFVVTLQWVWWLLALVIARWAWKYYKRIMASEKTAKPAVPVVGEK